MADADKVGGRIAAEERPIQIKWLVSLSRTLSHPDRYQEQTTYSDDEFSSDGGEYEAEFEGDGAETESSVEDAPELATPREDPSDARELDPQVPNSSDPEQPSPPQGDPPEAEPAEKATLETSGVADDALDGDEDSKGIRRASSPLESDSFQEDEEEELLPPHKLIHGQAASGTGEPPESVQSLRHIGQLGRAGTLRSLSTPAVPAVSLVNPSLLIPRNQRSTSVPVVLSEEIPDVHKLDKFRIEGRPGSSGSPRVKSIPRLSSVEELQALNDAGSSSEEDDSDSEESGSNRAAAPAPSHMSPRGRSSSFQLKQPVFISPVLRTRSQPFMIRLPSVSEGTAEELVATESARDEDASRGDVSSQTSETPNANDPVNAADTANAVVNGDVSDKTASETDASNAVGVPSGDRATEGKAASAPMLQGDDGQLSSSSDAAPQGDCDAGDDYEDEYEDQETSDTSAQRSGIDSDSDGAANKPNQVNVPPFTGEPKKDTDGERDDAYDGDNDYSAELHSEVANRRETEQLLHEAQMLLQKQHDRAMDASLSTSDQHETYEYDDERTEHTRAPGDIGKATALLHSESAEELGFEDHYGEEEFSDTDDADDGYRAAAEGEFDQYASDADEGEELDDNVAAPQEVYSAALEQTLPSRDAMSNPKEPNTDFLGSISVSDGIGGANETNATTLGGDDAAINSALGDVCALEPQDNASMTAEDETRVELLHSADAASEGERVAGPQEFINDSSPPATDQAEESASNGKRDQEPKARDVAKEEEALPLESESPAKKASAKAPQAPSSTRPIRPAPPAANETRTAKPARPAPMPRATASKAEASPRQPALTRERPRELRLKAERSASRQSADSCTAVAQATTSSRLHYEAHPGANAVQQSKLDEAREDPHRVTTTSTANAEAEPPTSSERHARRSPQKAAASTPRVTVEENELPPRRAPVFKQKTRKKTEERRRKLLPVKSPPNLRVDLPSMDKTKRNWLFVNMFRHGDDVSKYEPFIPKLVAPTSPQQSAGRPTRPYSATQQSRASSQADAAEAYGDKRSSRNGRRLVTQQDLALRERERNWASVRPLESAIPTYDSILDKFCTTVTSPVVQRQIYQARHDDLSPQLAYVLEKRVEKQWKSEAGEAFGAASTSYTTSIIPALATPHATSPSNTTLSSPSM